MRKSVIQFHLNIVQHQTITTKPTSAYSKAFAELTGTKQKKSWHSEAMRYSGDENGECHIVWLSLIVTKANQNAPWCIHAKYSDTAGMEWMILLCQDLKGEESSPDWMEELHACYKGEFNAKQTSFDAWVASCADTKSVLKNHWCRFNTHLGMMVASWLIAISSRNFKHSLGAESGWKQYCAAFIEKKVYFHPVNPSTRWKP